MSGNNDKFINHQDGLDIKAELNRIAGNSSDIGTLTGLNTSSKTSLVSAINEVNTYKQSQTLSHSIGGQTKVEKCLDTLNTGINSLKAAVGTPLNATTSSAMTDHNKIYVFTGTTSGNYTNGHWYYWDGSAWADGGVYNSVAVETDKTLTVSDMPADAKVTGDEITDLKEDFDALGLSVVNGAINVTYTV